MLQTGGCEHARRNRNPTEMILILSAVMNTQDNYGKMIEKLFNYFATIPGLPRAVGRAGILQKISWRVFAA
jgi:hypothetical protein